MTWLRCRPFAFWLAFTTLSVAFLAGAALWGGTLSSPTRYRAESSADLAVMVPDVLAAASAQDGTLATQVHALQSRARAHARTLDMAGSVRSSQAYQEVARYAGTLVDEPDADGARWRAEQLAAAVSALGVGSLDPVPDAAWDGPPAPVVATTVPPAADRLAAMLPSTHP